MKLYLFGLFLSLFYASHVDAITLSGFKNFSKQITMEAGHDGWFRLLDRQQPQVKISQRIIVKVEPDTTKAHIRKAEPAIEKITELYRMLNGRYFLLEINPKSTYQHTFDHLSTLPFVRLIQPDILQKSTKSTSSKTAMNRASPYLRTLGIPSLWKKSLGRGVKIAIIDDGFDLNHEDLKGTPVAFAYDVEMQTLDASPKHPEDTHGTQVAGIIFARHNEIGMDGIAPEAELIAIRHADTWTSRILLAFYLAKIAKADIINCSWTSNYLLEPVADVIHDLAETGRDGKGIAVVFAAGNQGRKLQRHSSEAALDEVISVGSVNLKHQRLKFSNYGSAVDLYAPGHIIQTTSSEGKNQYRYFSGTSASAPVVSSLIALMLALDSELTLSEIVKSLRQRLGRKTIDR